jgi:uncharacterized protein YraI
MLARNAIFLITATIIAAFSLSDANSKELIWGENVGPVFAEVARSEDGKDVSVHAGPSDKSRTIAHLKKGSQVRGYNKFKNGWMQLKQPYRGGWVKVSFLKPRAFSKRVTRVDPPDFCLSVRKGPGQKYPKVGCVAIGKRLTLSGVMTADTWLQTRDRKGWARASRVDVGGAVQPVKKAAQSGPSRSLPVSSAMTGDRISLVSPSGQTVPFGPGARILPIRTPHPGGGTAQPPGSGNGQNPPPGAAPPDSYCVGGYCVDPTRGSITENGQPIGVTECARASACLDALTDFVVDTVVEMNEQGDLENSVELPTPGGEGESLLVGADGRVQGFPSGWITAQCGTSEGLDEECLKEAITRFFENQIDIVDGRTPQRDAQTASQQSAPETLAGGGQGGTGSLAPPAEIPGSDDSGSVLTGKKEEGTGGTSETSGDESSGWMTIQPVGGNPPAESGGGLGPSETPGSGKGGDSGWATIQPVGGSAPVFTSEGDDGKDFGGGKKDAPVIGGGGNPPAGPTQGFVVGDPVDSDFGGGGSSDSSSSGPGFGGSAPGVSISEPSEFTGRGGGSGGANESTSGGFSRGDAADFGGGTNVGGNSSVSSGSPSGSSGSDLGSSTAQGVSMSDSSAATGKTGGSSSSGGTGGGVSITKGFKGRR